MHRHDQGFFYPGTGAAREGGVGAGAGATLNVPWLTGGATDGDYVAAFAHVLLPAAYEAAPSLIIVSAGFDAAAGDPIGGCRVTPSGFAHMAHGLLGVAPCAFLLEGGYNLDATAASIAAVARVALGGRPPRLLDAAPRPVAMLAIHQTAVAQARHWACLRGLAGAQPFGLAGERLPFSRAEAEEDEDEGEEAPGSPRGHERPPAPSADAGRPLSPRSPRRPRLPAAARAAALDAALGAALAAHKGASRLPQGRGQRRLRVMHALHLVALRALAKRVARRGGAGGGGRGDYV